MIILLVVFQVAVEYSPIMFPKQVLPHLKNTIVPYGAKQLGTPETSPPEPSIIPKFLDYFADFPYSRYSNTPELPKRGYLMRLLVRFNSDTKVTRIFMELRFHNDF